jgi:hypothetical protein
MPPPPACRGLPAWAGLRAGARRFRSRHDNFHGRGFTTPGVKLILLIGSGVFLLQTLADILFEEFVDKEFVERRDVLSHICEGV